MLNISKDDIEMVVCREAKYAMFPKLLFGKAKDGTSFFDATAYISKVNGDLSVQRFQAKYAAPCMAIARAYGFPYAQGYRLNADGHTIIDERFVFAFLSYVSDDFLSYACERIDEVLSYGFTVEDNYILGAVLTRFDKDFIMNAYDAKDKQQQGNDIQ